MAAILTAALLGLASSAEAAPPVDPRAWDDLAAQPVSLAYRLVSPPAERFPLLAGTSLELYR